MKMSQEHFETLKTAIEPLVPNFKAHYEALKVNPKVKDLETRFLWDVFWAANVQTRYHWDYKDAHIQTAVKKAVIELGFTLKENA